MADLSAAIAKAKRAGYSDAEITAYLGNDPTFAPKVQKAKSAGYGDGEIVSFLGKVNKTADVAKSFVGGIGQGVAGIADMVTQASPVGVVGNLFQNAAGVADMMRGGGAPKAANPFSGHSATANRAAYKPQTVAGEYARTVGQNVPNALAPGGALARTANVLVPAVASETAGQVARAAGAGRTGETVARAVGGLGGAAAASVRPANIFRPPDQPVEMMATRSRQDPAAMRARADQFRQAGIQPTLTDVVDDAGRGVIKAAASRQNGGRQAANDFARTRALNLPDRMSQQARRSMSRDARTPDEIRTAMGARRSANADRAFGAVRGDVVQLGDDALATFRVPEVADAVLAASRRERDPAVRGELARLAQWAKSGSAPAKAPRITVGMADRISRVLLGKANGERDQDLAATLRQFGQGIRRPTRDASPGYADALEGYGADTRLQQAAGVGEEVLVRNTDEFVTQARQLAPRERVLAAAAGRRAIERASGENISAAPGIARKIADTPEQQARNEALLGPARAERLQQGMRAEAQAVDNANMIAPGRGSPTHLNDQDAARTAGMMQIGQRIIRRDVIGLAMDWLRTRGMDDNQAEALVRMATDPAQTEQAMQIIAQRLGPQPAREFLSLRNAGLIGVAAGTTGFRGSTPEERQ